MRYTHGTLVHLFDIHTHLKTQKIRSANSGILDLAFFWTLYPFSSPLCEAATLGRAEGGKLPALSSGFLLGKEKIGGEENGVNKRGSCSCAVGESLADS